MNNANRFVAKSSPNAMKDEELHTFSIEISGGVWACAPVSECPEVVLSNWSVYEVQLPGPTGRTRHFVGQNVRGCEGRVSSAIVTFDAASAAGITQSGRVYRLKEAAGFTVDGQYVWNSWKRINLVSDVVDVSAEITKLIEKK